MNEKPLRVVFFLNDLLVGGMQKQFSEQMRHFDRQRFDITLVTLFTFEGKETLYAMLPSDLPIHKLQFKGWWDLVSWLKCWRLMRSLQPHIVVSSLFFANTVSRVLKPLVGFVSVAREHNTYTTKARLHQWVDRLLAPLSYKIVAVSSTVRDFTAKQERLPLSKFIVIHNGIDAAQASQKLGSLADIHVLKEQYGFSPQDLVFLNVARLTPQKNHELLIDAFAAFNVHHPECKLALVGEGGTRHTLEERVRNLGAEKSIIFFGHQRDPWPFYKMADAFISTSRIEGLSNAYLEALTAGLPLIATNTSGTDELLVEEKNGFFIQEATVEAAVEVLEKLLLSDKEALSRHAQEGVKKFDIRETVKKYENLFTSAYPAAEK